MDNGQGSASMGEVNPAKHAPAKSRTPGLGAAWAVLIGTGITSVTYNVVHATQGARLEVALAVLLGLAPAFVAACLSHVAAVLDAPAWVKAAVIAVMLAGMVLSASATAAVAAPADPGWRGWLFGATLDAAALLALWAILTARGRKNEAAMAVAAGQAEAQAARAEVAAAEGERSRMAEELALVRAELEAARLRASTRKPKRRPARKRTGISGSASAPVSGPVSGAEDDDLDAEAAALKLWMADQTIPGSKLGPMVGRTDSWGRGAVRKFKQTAPEGRPDARSDERS